MNRFTVHYFVIFDDAVLDALLPSPFQGFSKGVLSVSHLVRGCLTLPASITELVQNRAAVVNQRILGLCPYKLYIVPLSGLPEAINLEVDSAFVVVLTADKNATRLVNEFRNKSKIALVLAGPGPEADTIPENLSRKHIGELLFRPPVGPYSPKLSAPHVKWENDKLTKLKLDKGPHNILAPVVNALMSVGRAVEFATPIQIGVERDYIDAIKRVNSALRELRPSGNRSFNRLIIASPSASFAKLWGSSKVCITSRELALAKRTHAKSTTYATKSTPGKILNHSFMVVTQIRQQELSMFTNALALASASFMAPVIRLPNASGYHSGELRAYKECVGNRGHRWPEKAFKLFSALNERMRPLGNFTPEIRELFERNILVVSDYPWEWFVVDQLPLMLHAKCSRIPASPGDLCLQLLSNWQAYRIPVQAFKEPLVIRSFDQDDPISKFFEAEYRFREQQGLCIKAKFVDVYSETEFCSAINEHDGEVVILDCHGKHMHKSPSAGTIKIGKDDVNPRLLSDKLKRMPKIWVLGACETHSVYGSHYTVASALLSLRAKAVIGTHVPVHARQNAVFMARFLYWLHAAVNEVEQGRLPSFDFSAVYFAVVRKHYLRGLLSMLLKKGYLNRYQVESLDFDFGIRILKCEQDLWRQIREQLAFACNCSTEILGEVIRQYTPRADALRYLSLGLPDRLTIVPGPSA